MTDPDPIADEIRAGIVNARTLFEPRPIADAEPEGLPELTRAEAVDMAAQAWREKREAEDELNRHLGARQQLYVAKELLDSDAYESVPAVADSIRALDPTLVPELVDQWAVYDPAAADTWAEGAEVAARAQQAVDAARQAKAAADAEGARLVAEQEAAATEIRAALHGRHPEAARAEFAAEIVAAAPKVLEMLEAEKFPGRDDPAVVAEAAYRYVRAHKDAEAAGAILDATAFQKGDGERHVTVDLRDLAADHSIAYRGAADVEAELARLAVGSLSAVQRIGREVNGTPLPTNRKPEPAAPRSARPSNLVDDDEARDEFYKFMQEPSRTSWHTPKRSK